MHGGRHAPCGAATEYWTRELALIFHFRGRGLSSGPPGEKGQAHSKSMTTETPPMNSSRRNFLKQIGITGIGIGLGPVVPWSFGEPSAAIGASLPRSTPEAEGVASSGILAFLDGIAHTKSELHSFMLVRHGKVIAEGWWSPYAPELRHTMYSMSKSFTSTAVGLAVAEGRLSVDDKVVSFFPEDLPAQVSDELASLRVKHLLSMAVGHEPDSTHTVVKEDNWVRAFLAQPFKHAPGSVFLYNSAGTYLCSAIVQKLTGQKIVDYLTPRLFEPLGIRGMTWETCPRGINTGGWGLSIQTEGLAKFGQLYLKQGEWNGRRILPAKWVGEATTFKIQQPSPEKPTRPQEQNDWLQGYCYQFWRSQHHAFRGDGAFGQFTLVMPEQDAVVIMTGESKDLQGELDLVWKHLLPAMQDKPLAADETTHAKLRQTLSSLALLPPKVQPASPTAGRISGRTFKLDANGLDMDSVGFQIGEKSCVFTAQVKEAAHRITHGIESWQHGATQMPGTPPRIIAGNHPEKNYKVAASATWSDEHTLELTWRYIETPHHDSVTCKFDGDQVAITFLSSIAKLNGKEKETRPRLQGRIAG